MEQKKLQLKYEVLDHTNEKEVKEAAMILAETFTGVQVGKAFIREPMAYACDLTTERFYLFTEGYLSSIASHGLTTVAKDENGQIVAVLACENFNPEEEAPVFDGELEPMNHIIDFLMHLDVDFVERATDMLGRPIRDKEFVHAFMVGVKLELNKKEVAVKLFELMEEEAMKVGYKGVFGEATNKRSQRLMFELLDYYTPVSINGTPIVKRYDTHEVFGSIPKEISEECSLVYKELSDGYNLK